MKKSYLLLLIVFSSVLFSCSDKLSNSKAESIIEDYINNTPLIKTENIRVGNMVSISGSSNVKNLLGLQEKGLLTMESNPPDSGYDEAAKKEFYKIFLTEKGEKYVESRDEPIETKLYTVTWLKVKVYDYKLEKVISVFETPSSNTAEVECMFKKIKTPFFDDLADDKEEFVTEHLQFKKMADGWALSN